MRHGKSIPIGWLLWLVLVVSTVSAQDSIEEARGWLQGDWVEVKDGKAVNMFTFFDGEWLAMDTSFKKLNSPVLYRIEEIEVAEDPLSVASFEKLDAALAGRTGREMSRMSGLEQEQWRYSLDKETRIAMLTMALRPRREHKLNPFDFGGERGDLTRIDVKVARPTNAGSEFPRPMEFKTQWLKFLRGETRLYVVDNENRNFVRADMLSASERESYEVLARGNRGYFQMVYESYRVRVLQLTRAGIPADECREWQNSLLSLGVKKSPDIQLDSTREVPLPDDGLYSFLKYVEAARTPDAPTPPELRYFFRTPACAQGNARMLYPAFAGQVARDRYMDTVWVMQISPALNDQPKNWDGSAYTKYTEAFRGRPSHQKIAIHLRPDGVFGFRGEYDASNRWRYGSEGLALTWGSLGLEAVFPLKSRDGKYHQTTGPASLFGGTVAVRFAMFTSYTNFYSDFSHHHLWAAALQAKYQEEAALPPLECWPGGPDDLAGIPEGYWLRDRSAVASAPLPVAKTAPAAQEIPASSAPVPEIPSQPEAPPAPVAIKEVEEGPNWVGRWRWSNGLTIQIEADGTARNGVIVGKWTRVDASASSFQIDWPDGMETVTLAADGKSFGGTGFFGAKLSAERVGSGGDGVVGIWRRHDGLVMNIKADGAIDAGPFKGSWKQLNGQSYQFAYPIVDQVEVSADGKSLEARNQFGSVTARRD